WFGRATGGLLLGLTAWCAVGVGMAHAQDVRSLSDRLDRLQRDVDTLGRQVGGRSAPFTTPAPQGAPPGGFSSSFIDRTDARFSDLESRVRELTGKLEEIPYRLGEISQRLDKLVGDVDYRLSGVERGGGGPPPAAPIPPATRQSAQALPSPPAS